MRGALKITFQDGSTEYFEVDPVGGKPDFAQNLQRFLASPTISLILENEVLVIPSTSIRQISITRLEKDLPLEQLQHVPGVLVGAKRILG
jgi:hypothetical protein